MTTKKATKKCMGKFKHHKFTTMRNGVWYCTRCGKKLEDDE